jgi:hypothetical protein
MSEMLLLAIIEVPYKKRVRCTASECGRSVYRRVHVIRMGDALRIYGSECFAREFCGQQVKGSKPRLTSSAGRKLTNEERELLVSNTERLMQIWEGELATSLDTPKATRGQARRSRKQVARKSPEFSEAERASVEAEVRAVLSAEFPGIDFDAPGFNGLLQSRIDLMLREKIAARS